MANFSPRFKPKLQNSGLGFYMQQAQQKANTKTKWCPNHPWHLIEDKYEVCWRCHMKQKEKNES